MISKKQLLCIGCAKQVDVNKLQLVRVPKKQPSGLITLIDKYNYKCPNCGVESIFNADLVKEVKMYEK